MPDSSFESQTESGAELRFKFELNINRGGDLAPNYKVLIIIEDIERAFKPG